RAIRLVYGPLLENDTAAFEALLTGFWALEQTRVANGLQTALTWSDLRSAVSSHFAAYGQPEPPLPVGLQFLLLSAAGSTGVDLELSRFSIVARHHSVRAWGLAGAGETVGGAVAADAEMTILAPPAGSSASAFAQDVAEPPVAPGVFTGPDDFLLSAETLVTGPSGRPQGRNWTGRPAGRVQPGTVRVIEDRPGVAPKVVSAGPAPWPGTAYVVAADGADGRVRLPDGRVLDGEGLAAVLAADPELAKLPGDVPVVLAVPFVGQQYQETLLLAAHRLGRTVWGASGVAGLVLDESGNAHVPVLMDLDPDAPVGVWVKVLPPAAPVRHVDRTWTALDGTVFRDSDVLTRPLADETHERLGRLAVPQNEQRLMERRWRTFRRMRWLVHLMPAGEWYHERGAEPVSLDAAVYVFAAHGLPGRMGLPLRDGRTVWLGKRDAAAYIAGLPEVLALPPGTRIHLEICWSASDGDPHTEQAPYAPAPHVDDPLGEVPFDQHLAELTRKKTDGVTRPIGVDDVRRLTIDAANGEPGRLVENPPEPLEHQLDQLARDVGLHHGTGAVPSEVRDAALRLVRALRRVFGNEIENDRGVPGGRYERVLKGIGALERMRANDPALSAFTPFRMDLLDFYVQKHTGRSPDRAGYLALFDFAASRVAADPTARLTDVVPSPALQITLRHLADKHERAIRHVQSLSASAAVTPRHVASTLWAMARAAQVFRRLTPTGREAMGRKVLHLDSTTTWDRSQQGALWAVTAKAIAEGVDVSDHDLLAAFHLKEAGAFGPAAVLRQGPNVQGFNWSDGAAPAGINWGTVFEGGAEPGDINPVQPDWVGPARRIPTLRVVEVDGAGTVVVHLAGRAPVPVTENEFLALLGFDPELSAFPLAVPVLFLTTGPGGLSPQLVRLFSLSTGRPAFGYSAPMMLLSDAPSVPLGILTLPDPATGAPGHWTTATRQPTTPGTTTVQDAPIVFGLEGSAPAQAPDTGALRLGEGGEPPAGSLLSPGTLMTNASGVPRGRNLTGEKVRRLRVGRVRVFEEQPGAPLKEVQGADADAPWGDTAYIVWGESHPDGVRFPDGRVLNAEKLAAELAADPELAKLPKTVPVVLVVPNLANERYLEYLRAVANLVERTAWAPSGDGSLVRDKKREHVPALIDHGPDHPLGAWVPFQPTKASVPFVDREWTALDGTKFRDSDVASRPVVSDRHERFGRMSHADDVRGRERLMRSYLRARKRVHLMASGGRTVLISEEERTPDLAVYVFVAHGLPGGLLLALRDGRTVWLSAADGGRYIGGLPEVTELPGGHRMKLELCFSGSAGNPTVPQLDNRPAPPVHDPLEEVSLVQHTANESRRVAIGSLMSSGYDVGAHILLDTPGGVAGRREVAFPELLPHELDRMARTAGLHTGEGEASPGVRTTTLRLLRALRMVFGPETEADSGLHERLVTGIGALETLRANDPELSRFTPFRMELWTFLAERVSGGTPGPADYRSVLDVAAQRLSQNPAARLGEALPDPVILHAQRQITQFGAVLVRNILRLPENAPVTKKAVTWAFWAVAGAVRQMAGRDEAFTERLGRRVLHLLPGEPWSPAKKRQLWVLTAQAVAARLDPADHFTLAAFHLASKGAFGPARALMDGEKFQGYNWSGTPAPGGVDLRVVGRQERDGDGTSLTHFRAPWRADGEPEDVMVVWTDTDADGFAVLHLPGMPPFRVADEELLALLDMAPPLRVTSLAVPVLFVLSGPGSGAGRPMTLSEAFSHRTARNGWAYSGPLTVAPGTPPQGTGVAPLRLIGLPEAGTGKQGVWHKAWLQGLGSSVLEPAPYGDAVFSSPRPSGLPRSRTGAEVTVRSPRSRADLVALALEVAGREPVRDMPVERCLVLLGALRKALHPRGVRPAVAVDDEAVADLSAAPSLVVGPGWRAVRSWDAVAAAVAAQGPGAVAFVLARRQGGALGHAWAAYHAAGSDGVLWVDVSAGAGRQVSALPPSVAASDARAVVVDPSGRAVEHALPEFAQSSSTAHAVLDAATGRRFGALGLEVEEHRDLFINLELPGGILSTTLTLAHGPGITLVTDGRPFWWTADGLLHVNEPQEEPGQPKPVMQKLTIGEFVVDPMAVLPGERRQSPEEAMARLQQARAAASIADERQDAVPLTEVLGPLGGWTFTEAGEATSVNPAPVGFNGTAYAQVTLGYPAVGLRELQHFTAQRLSRSRFTHLMSGGRVFGLTAAVMFANSVLGRAAVEHHLVPFLAAVPDVDEVWGYGWLGFQNVAAAPIGEIMDSGPFTGTDPTLIKNLLPAASRHALDRVRRALRPRTRTFFAEHHDRLTQVVVQQMGRLLELYRRMWAPDQPAGAGFFDTVGVDVPTPREHWTAVLTGRTSYGAAVSQRYAVGMDDDGYPVLDTDDGRLEIPLVLMELRHFGYTGEFMTPEELQRAVTELSELSRSAYERALLFRTPLPEDVLRESILRITENPVVRGVGGFLVVASLTGVPQAGGPTKTLMTDWDARDIALRLGEYALGRALHDDDPAYRRLRTALSEAYELLPQMPPGGGQARARSIFDEARTALDILADPWQTPPVMPWFAELVAVDGARVPLDRVLVVGHRDAEGRPVGTSSRPVQDWQDAHRHHYGLLPGVVGFTLVRPGPVPLESPVQTLPFADAYLVGLSGGPTVASLVLSDGSEEVVDYARVVDFLFAVDGHLSALAPERPVLVVGADLAG
ncbi:lonely Cys domain-containing protein, partial [Streptomyces sp. NPDC058735]|uniref:lonely Cys domain-containing protein n=1 Tax=Streptomyces sp. NPDC058735 TaxID=3346616 RepID=UPI0036ADDE5E